MASAKIASLAIRTVAKPIATYLKGQATQHESFRNICISIAQRMHRTEGKLRMNLLNEPAKNIKPLNDTRAIQNGATTLAEGFLFFVAASLIVGESYRGRQSTAKRRDDVDDALEGLRKEVEVLKSLVEGLDDKVAKMGASRLENGSEREGGGDTGSVGNDSSRSPTKVTTASDEALEQSTLQVGGPTGSGERRSTVLSQLSGVEEGAAISGTTPTVPMNGSMYGLMPSSRTSML